MSQYNYCHLYPEQKEYVPLRGPSAERHTEKSFSPVHYPNAAHCPNAV